MRRMTWGDALVGLTLVRLGQELGTNSPLARAVFDLAEALSRFAGIVSQVSGI